MWSGSLLRGDSGKRGPSLLDVLAAGVRTLHLAFVVIHGGQNFVEEFRAVTAEEFVVGHTDLHSFEKGDDRILAPLVGRFNMGVRFTNSACPGRGFFRKSGSRILRAVEKKGAWERAFIDSKFTPSPWLWLLNIFSDDRTLRVTSKTQ